MYTDMFKNSFVVAGAVLFSIGCQTHNAANTAHATNTAARTTEATDIDSITAANKEDSFEAAFENGKIVYATIVRLNSYKSGYFYSDSVYRPIPNGYLLKDSAESYYEYAITKIRPDDIKVHDLVWSIKEVRDEAADNWGGYHGVFSIIDTRPDDAGSDGFYLVSIKRLYEHRMGRVFPLGLLRVKLHPRQVFVETPDGNFVPLDKWRKLPDDQK